MIAGAKKGHTSTQDRLPWSATPSHWSGRRNEHGAAVGNWASAGPEKQAEESDAGDKSRTGMHEGETGPAQGAPLGSFGVASARSIFPSQASPHYCSYQGGGREGRSGAAWAPRTDLLGPQHQPTPTTIIIITVIIPRSLLRNAPHQRGVLRAVKAVPIHGSPQHKKKEEYQTPGWGLRSFLLPICLRRKPTQKHIVAYIKRCRGCERMVHRTKVNHCVTGCNRQPGMTHFPEWWTRLGRRRRWLASPSELARERAREKKGKKRGARSMQASFADGAVAMVEGGIHRREKEKNSWLVAACWVAGAGRVPVHVRLGHPHYACIRRSLAP